MPRQPKVQITRDPRADGSVTFGLRVRIAGGDERVSLGNESEGWDESRVEKARKQLLAKIELGLWSPRPDARAVPGDAEPTFRELATDWLEARRRNPAIRPRTIELNEWQLRRYLAPFFGELLPSQITRNTIKEYRQRIHTENAQIRDAEASGGPLRDPRSGLRLRTLGNDSINKSLRTLASILDEAEDGGWIDRNVARERRTREPLERRHNRGVLDLDEFSALLEAARQIDNRHLPLTVERAEQVRLLRDVAGLSWKEIGDRIGVAPTTAIYLHGCRDDEAATTCGVRRAIIATLGFAGPRVGELCLLDNQDINLARARFSIRDSKTDAGVRLVDIHPALLDELSSYFAGRAPATMDAPAFPTRARTRRDRSNVLQRVVHPIVARANAMRAERDEPPILAHVTPHTFRRTYITFMVAAGYDLPYVQAQVGHVDPTTTLAIYAQLIAGHDRDQLRAEIRSLLGVDQPSQDAAQRPLRTRPETSAVTSLRSNQKAGNGRATHR
jgi:integrase